MGLDGQLYQWVDEQNTAWQAGNYPTNQTTIGIEHDDAGNYDDAVRTPALYAASAQLLAEICQRYGFPADANHVFLHKNVIDKAKYPGGTGCPDGLDTNRIILAAQALLGGNMTTEDQVRKSILGVTGNTMPTAQYEGEVRYWTGRSHDEFANYLYALGDNYILVQLKKVAYLEEQLDKSAVAKVVADVQAVLDTYKAAA